ncbi:hypothetical protein P6U16_02895 [Rhizobium sp. 32-5/1]|nr:hypothetical protein [Rhizobium sp. 32-5/1]WEZ85269.1 hypothetical protein P6U16_02895 [Rhizobium sp. 32-5/1]
MMMIMMMFFAGLPLDIAMPAVVLVAAMALDWTAFHLIGRLSQEGRAA